MSVVPLHADLSEYVTKRELAEKLRVSSSMIDRWQKEGMPVHRWSKQIRRYRVVEVERWLARRSL